MQAENWQNTGSLRQEKTSKNYSPRKCTSRDICCCSDNFPQIAVFRILSPNHTARFRALLKPSLKDTKWRWSTSTFPANPTISSLSLFLLLILRTFQIGQFDELMISRQLFPPFNLLQDCILFLIVYQCPFGSGTLSEFEDPNNIILV